MREWIINFRTDKWPDWNIHLTEDDGEFTAVYEMYEGVRSCIGRGRTEDEAIVNMEMMVREYRQND